MNKRPIAREYLVFLAGLLVGIIGSVVFWSQTPFPFGPGPLALGGWGWYGVESYFEALLLFQDWDNAFIAWAITLVPYLFYLFVRSF